MPTHAVAYVLAWLLVDGGDARTLACRPTTCRPTGRMHALTRVVAGRMPGRSVGLSKAQWSIKYKLKITNYTDYV
jgi:hypothetical protein